ncbi:MAG TPA: hypothetical protein VF589_11655 [Allosphingosinicella sp.]|jgi:hypothetical protein
MRAILAVAALAALAGCGEGGVVDDTVRAGLRQSTVEACLAWAPESTMVEAAGISRERLCACAADRILDGGITQLPDLSPDNPEIREAVRQCVGEIGAGAAPGVEG